MSIIYHGDENRNYNFWVYPKNLPLKNTIWDTWNLNKFCSNYTYKYSFINTGVRQYKCLGCKEQDEILVTILAKDKAGCLPFYLQCIYNQDYNKKKLHLYIRTNDNNDNTIDILKKFINQHKKEYASIYFDDTSVLPDLKQMRHREWNNTRFKILGKIRQDSINYAKKNNYHYFIADCDNFITPNTISTMMKYKQHKVVSPMLSTKTAYSNFHYDVDKNGYYKYNKNYYKILNKDMTGLLEVAVVHCTYFINKNTLKDINYDDNSGRYEYVIFSDVLRKKNIKQYLLNDKFYGFLTWHTDSSALKKDLQGYWKNYMKKFEV